MPTKRQIENAHMRGAYLALAFTGSMTWREIEALFPSIPSGTMKHNSQRAKRSCAKAGITSPTLRELLLHAEEAPRGGAEARLIYPVGSAVSEKLKERAMHYEGQKDVGLKQIVEEASAATGVRIALSTAVRILKDHHGIQRRGPNRKRMVKEKMVSVEKSKEKSTIVQAQDQHQRREPDGHLLVDEQGDMSAEAAVRSHHAPVRPTTSNDRHVPNHDITRTKDYTSADLNAANQEYTAEDQHTVRHDSDTAAQQDRMFQFMPSHHFPLYDPSAMRDSYQSHDHNGSHHDSFSNYIDPNLDSGQENVQHVS
ncbi:hypothetical protein MBLNU457_3748t1 [Dothideomycetes sp. NU457]